MSIIYERFIAVDSIKDKKIKPKEQKELIAKLQNDTITMDEANTLIASLYDLVINQARKMFYNFPDRDLEDLIEDGVYNLWLRLPGYDHTRSGPSTYATIVVRSAFLKELSKLKNRTPFRTTIDEETKEKKKDLIPNVSLQNFIDEDDHTYEPNFLGKEDYTRLNAENRIYFEELVLDMYNDVCKNIVDFRILNNILNIKKLPNFGGGRRRKSLNKIAENCNVKISYVENLAKKVNPWLKKHDFISFLINNEYETPDIQSVFEDNDIVNEFEKEHIIDVWEVLGI